MALVGGIVAGGILDIAGGLIGGAMDAKAREDQEDFIKNHLLGRRFQYAVEDLYKAGLNPALAYSNPASAPAPGQISPGRYVSDAASSIGSSVRDYQAKKAAIANVQMDTDKKYEEGRAAGKQTEVLDTQKKLNTQLEAESQARAIREAATAREVLADTRLKEARIPGAEAEAAIDRSWYGQATRALNRLNPFANTAGNLAK